MNSFIATLCFVSLILASVAQLNIKSPFSDVAKQIEQILQNNRQSFADGFKGLPTLDPLFISGPMKLNADPFRATVSNIKVNKLSTFNETSLDILSNGLFIFTVKVPQISVEGYLTIPVGASIYTGTLESLLSDVWIAINGHVSVSNNQITLSEVHVDITVNEVPMVKVIGFPGSNQWTNNFINKFLRDNLNKVINNDSTIYESALSDVVTKYLTSALGKSYSELIYKINLLA
ncbi:uncharacterized protein LOC123293794 [Chrysoperla carnea]|uniref:uncharacterized protein LOC123293794 n=1 Tax=Chrysoperla carnea TaxID=189513 RepID=UPI001D0797B8|nr:uncharacterized protein LOC123293794 [Chrysoperla carnea]